MARDEARRYRISPDVVRTAAGPARALVYDPLSGATGLLGRDDLALLTACVRFDSIEGHARRLGGSEPGRREAIGQRLQALANQGLLGAEDELRSSLGRAPASARPGVSLRHVGVPTRGRPDALRRAVESIIGNLERHGRTARIVVCNDGQGGQTQATAEVVVRLAGPRNTVVAYMDRRARARYADALAQHGGLDAALCRWALLGEDGDLVTTGAARNTLLLDAAGESTAWLDDDTVCELRAPPDRQEGLVLTARNDPSALWFAEPDGDLAAQLDPEDTDVLGVHETLLGRQLGACIESGPELHVAELSPRFAQRIARGAQIRRTHLGSYGDGGTGSLGHYLLLEGPSRERLHASEPCYRHAFESGQLARAVSRPTAVMRAGCMTMAVALDARQLVAPFSPQLRNSDGVFGVVAGACFGDDATGLLPSAVKHEPLPPRSYSFERFVEELEWMGGNDLLCRVIANLAPRVLSANPADNLRSLGRALTTLAELPLEPFEAQVREWVLRGRATDLRLLEEALARHDCEPSWWALDVRRASMALGETVIRPQHSRAQDLERHHGESEGRDRFRQHVRRYGRLLTLWPDLWETARALRAKGVQPSAG